MADNPISNAIDSIFRGVFGILTAFAPNSASNAAGSSAAFDRTRNPKGVPKITQPHQTSADGTGVIVKTADGVYQVDQTDFVQTGTVQTLQGKGNLTGIQYTIKGGTGDPTTVEGALAIGWAWALGRPGPRDTHCNMKNSDGSKVLLLPFKYASTPRDIGGKTDAAVYAAALKDAQGGPSIPTSGAEGFIVGQAASQVPFAGTAIGLFNSITGDDPRQLAADAVANHDLHQALADSIPLPPAYIQQQQDLIDQFNAQHDAGVSTTGVQGSYNLVVDDYLAADQVQKINDALDPSIKLETSTARKVLKE